MPFTMVRVILPHLVRGICDLSYRGARCPHTGAGLVSGCFLCNIGPLSTEEVSHADYHADPL